VYLVHLILEIIQKPINVVIYTIGIQAVNEGKISISIIEKSFPVVATSLEIAAMKVKLSRM
jgi:hypothetical protein